MKGFGFHAYPQSSSILLQLQEKSVWGHLQPWSVCLWSSVSQNRKYKTAFKTLSNCFCHQLHPGFTRIIWSIKCPFVSLTAGHQMFPPLPKNVCSHCFWPEATSLQVTPLQVYLSTLIGYTLFSLQEKQDDKWHNSFNCPTAVTEHVQ